MNGCKPSSPINKDGDNETSDTIPVASEKPNTEAEQPPFVNSPPAKTQYPKGLGILYLNIRPGDSLTFFVGSQKTSEEAVTIYLNQNWELLPVGGEASNLSPFTSSGELADFSLRWMGIHPTTGAMEIQLNKTQPTVWFRRDGINKHQFVPWKQYLHFAPITALGQVTIYPSIGDTTHSIGICTEVYHILEVNDNWARIAPIDTKSSHFDSTTTLGWIKWYSDTFNIHVMDVFELEHFYLEE